MRAHGCLSSSPQPKTRYPAANTTKNTPAENSPLAKNGLKPNALPNGHPPDPSPYLPSIKNNLRKIISPPSAISRKTPLASQNPATRLMFRLTRPSPAARTPAVAGTGAAVAAGPAINCFPHATQYRVLELNGLPHPSQYMPLSPSSPFSVQYYVSHPKMFH